MNFYNWDEEENPVHPINILDAKARTLGTVIGWGLFALAGLVVLWVARQWWGDAHNG